jgi:hypothetical protein
MRGGVIDVARAAVDPDEAIRGDDRDDRQETESAADVGADQTHDAARQVPALRPNALDAHTEIDQPPAAKAAKRHVGSRSPAPGSALSCGGSHVRFTGDTSRTAEPVVTFRLDGEESRHGRGNRHFSVAV